MSTGLWMGTLASSLADGGVGSLEPIQTATVGSGGSAFVEFSSISSNYQHLHIRYMGAITSGAYGYAGIRLNATNQAYMQELGGNYASEYSGGSFAWIGTWLGGPIYRSTSFAVSTIDIVDANSTTKTKAVRALGGYSHGTTQVHGSYLSIRNFIFTGVTAAVNTVRLTAHTSNGGAGTFTQGSTFALYGILAE